MTDHEARERVEKLYGSWRERVGRDKANMMLGVLTMSMVMSNRGFDEDDVADAFEEALKAILGLEIVSHGELHETNTLH